MYSSERGSPAGMPSTMTSRPLPCDSPAVRKRNSGIDQSFRSRIFRSLADPSEWLNGAQAARRFEGEAAAGAGNEFIGRGRLPVEVLDVVAVDDRAENAPRFGETMLVAERGVNVDLGEIWPDVGDVVEEEVGKLLRDLLALRDRAARLDAAAVDKRILAFGAAV